MKNKFCRSLHRLVSVGAFLAAGLASAQTQPADWFYIRLDWGQTMGNSVSMDVTTQGYWAVAYDDVVTQTLKCAYLLPSGQAFTKETVMGGGAEASLAYDASEQINISHRYGSKLYHCAKIGSSWVNKIIDSKDVAPGATSLGFGSSGTPFVSYLKNGRTPGLYVAHRTGNNWTTQQVDAQAKAAIYNQIAFDPAGNPSVVYSHDADGNGSIDTLKFAHLNGSTWSTSVVDLGGSSATIAYDPTTSTPGLAHWNAATSELLYSRWNGATWIREIVTTAPAVTGCSLEFDQDGVAYVAFGTDQMLLAKRDLGGVWTILSIDSTTKGGLRNSLKGRPGGRPGAVAYKGARDLGYQVGPDPASSCTVRLALRQTPY